MSCRSSIEDSEVACGRPHDDDVSITEIKERFRQWNNGRINGVRQLRGCGCSAKIGTKTGRIGPTFGPYQ